MSAPVEGPGETVPEEPSAHTRLRRPMPKLTAEEQREKARLLADPQARRVASAEYAATQRAELIRRVEEFVARYVVLPHFSLLPVSLWIVATEVFDVFPSFPYLAIISAVKRSGKTRLLKVLKALCRAPMLFTFPSAAVLYRVIEKCKPTLLLDEVENLSNPRSDLAKDICAILNAGFEADGQVPRCGGKRGDKLEFFSVYSPKAFACIGRLPDTILDRSIILALQRRKPDETIERFIAHKVRREAKALRADITKTLAGLKKPITAAFENYPDLDFLTDRDADCWLPLFAVASVLAPDYVADLKDCAQALCGEKAESDVDGCLTMRLLADIQELWPKDAGQMFTRNLLQSLKSKEESPWAEEVLLKSRKLARMLKPFGIEPTTVRVGAETGKGYRLEDLESAFSRYLTSKT